MRTCFSCSMFKFCRLYVLRDAVTKLLSCFEGKDVASYEEAPQRSNRDSDRAMESDLFNVVIGISDTVKGDLSASTSARSSSSLSYL